MLLGSLPDIQPIWWGGGRAGRRGGHIVYWRYWVICWFWQDMRDAML